MKWTLSLSSGIAYTRPLSDLLAPVRQAGFSRMQVTAAPGHFDYRNNERVLSLRREMDRLGIRTTSMHAPYGGKADLSSLHESNRVAAVAEIERSADALVSLGGKVLVLHAGTEDEDARPQWRIRLSQSRASLARLYAYCRKLGLVLAVEDMLAHLVGGRTEEVLWVMESLPREGAGICLDIGHSYLTGELLHRVKQFGDRIVMVHAHDTMGVYDDHLPPGEGMVPWPSLLNRLADTGFDGEIVLEINDRPGAPDLIERARKSALFLQRLASAAGYSIDAG